MKRNAIVIGVFLLSALVVVVAGSVVPFTRISFGTVTTVEGPFVSILPQPSDNPLDDPFYSLIEILCHWLGIGAAHAPVFALTTLWLSFAATLVLLFSARLRSFTSRRVRYLVFVVYCATPALAVAIAGMLLYALVLDNSTVA